MRFLSSDVGDAIADIEALIGDPNQLKLIVQENRKHWYQVKGPNKYDCSGDTVTVFWDPTWMKGSIPSLVSLTHELAHARDFLEDGKMSPYPEEQNIAIDLENRLRLAFYCKVPGWTHLWPLRPHVK